MSQQMTPPAAAETLRPLYDRLLEMAPKAVFVIVLIIAGLIVAAVARRVTEWLVRRSGLEALFEKAGIAKLLHVLGLRSGAARLVGMSVGFAVLLLTAVAVADVLQLSAVSAVMALVVRYLPRLLATCVIILGGLSLAGLVRRVVTARASERDDVRSSAFVGHLAYYVIVIVSMTWAAEQAGLETSLVRWLLLLVSGLAMGSVALSFGLGSRSIFTNFTAAHYYGRMLHPGDRVTVGEHSGVVIRFTPVALILAAGDGRELVIAAESLVGAVVAVEPVEPTAPKVASASAVASNVS